MEEKILVFIPMYNCEKQIVRVAQQLTGDIAPFVTEAIFVNNRSTDGGEAALIEKLKTMSFPFNVKVLRNKENYGLGGSHKVAFNYALENDFDYIITLHGDDQGHITDLLSQLKSGEYQKYSCLLGSRFMKRSVLDGYSKFRTFGNRVYNILFSIVAGHRVCDLGSGLNMYSTEMLKGKWWLKFTDGLMFNCDMILVSYYRKNTVKFFPIRWSEDDQKSNVKMISQAFATLKLALAFLFNKKKFANKEHTINKSLKYDSDTIFEIKGV